MERRRSHRHPIRMAEGEREPSAARKIMPIAAMFLIVPTVMLALGLATLSELCEDGSPTDVVTACHQRTLWSLGGAAVSVTLAICSIIVAVRARTSENAWKGSIVLLIAAVPFSPLVGVFGG
jgi:ABC-type Fe3+ transport system permease subunit